MLKANLLTLCFLIAAAATGLAQKGKVRGTVIDDTSGEPMIGVTVVIKGTTNGAVTDFDGKFEIQIEAGTYDVQASFVSYATITISGLNVEAGETTVIEQIRMKEDVQELAEVVVTAEAIKTTEAALLTVKRKSANVLDGISAQTFKKIGASNAASAVKRVPGVSVQGGKYVYVRGLGDRYTKTILNSMEIPGLDPDRNTIQMDIFPTNVIDNIIVKKSFTADLPADFTGGIVDIETKDFPDEKTMSFSGSIGFNPDMHFNSNYLNYDGGATDFLGFDDGTRDLPISSRANIPLNVESRPSRREALTRVTAAFDPTLGATTSTSFANYSLGFGVGNQFKKQKFTIGYNAALSYRNTTTFYENVQDNNLYVKSADFGTNELDLDRSREGSEGSNNVLLGGLAGIALKTDASKFRINALHVQNGESTASVIRERNFLSSSNESVRDALAYSERSITNLLIAGDHYFNASNWSIAWKLTPTFSTINDKDVRLAPFTVSDEGGLSIEPSEGGNPRRLWRFLDEVNYSGKVDATKEFDLKGRKSKLKFGAANTYKERDFYIENFNFLIDNPDAISLGGDPNRILAPENIWQDGTGTYVIGNYQGSNSYESSILNIGFFVSTELALTDKFKAVLGIRGEQYTQRYTGGDQDFFNSNGNQGRFLNNEKVLDTFNPFPTANFIYNIIENSNLRVSYARTVARPSFKEKSIAQIFDPISNTTWIGNIDLIETDIDNFDLRWEYFFKGGQTVAVSGFYKTFANPIEVQVFNENASSDFTARNNGDAKVYGVEVEVRKNLDFVAPNLDNFSVNVNASLIESQLEMSEEELTSRQANLREGEELEDTRDMQGQSPYLVNFGINYDNFDNGWEGGLFYNVQGATLARVGLGEVPDLYTEAFHSLNMSIQKNFGPERKSSLTLRVSNLLDDKQETFFQSFGATDQISSSRALGRTFTLRFGYSF
ncbi:MAG: TonB-dependent receptor [Bacteroidota bacterium]